MLGLFNRFAIPIDVQGKGTEKAVFARVGKTNSSNFKSNFVFSCLLQENTAIENGDIVTASVGLQRRISNYIVISVRRADESIQATLYKTNGTARIMRPRIIYDEYDNAKESVLEYYCYAPVNHMTVNAAMRILNEGMLPSTTKEFRMPLCGVQLLDRIEISGEVFCVDAIDLTKFEGLAAIQTSNDNRHFDTRTGIPYVLPSEDWETWGNTPIKEDTSEKDKDGKEKGDSNESEKEKGDTGNQPTKGEKEDKEAKPAGDGNTANPPTTQTAKDAQTQPPIATSTNPFYIDVSDDLV